MEPPSPCCELAEVLDIYKKQLLIKGKTRNQETTVFIELVGECVLSCS